MRRSLISVAVLLVVTIVAATLVRAGGPDGDGGKPSPTPTSSAPDDDPGAELVAALKRGRALTYNAAYTVQSNDPEVAGGSLTIELWRKPPKVRQDTDNQADAKQARTAAIKSEKLIRCAQPAGGPWSCEMAAESETSDFDNLVDRVEAEVAVSKVTKSSEKVNGRDANCYVLKAHGGDVTQVCVDADGIPLRIASSDSRIEIARMSRAVNDNVFAPPAPVR